MKLLLGFLGLKGRVLSKRGVVYGTSVYRSESVDGKQRKGFYVVSLASTWLYFCTYLQCWSENSFLWMEGRGGGGGEERDQNMWKLL